jgi:hypothetical protein
MYFFINGNESRERKEFTKREIKGFTETRKTETKE